MATLFRWMRLLLSSFFRALAARYGAAALAVGLAGWPAAGRAQAPTFGPAAVVGAPAPRNGQSAVMGTAVDA